MKHYILVSARLLIIEVLHIYNEKSSSMEHPRYAVVEKEPSI